MKTVSPTELRSNIYKLLDEVLSSGIPLEINKGGKLLRIIPMESNDKLTKLASRPDAIIGNPDELADIHWEKEINLDIP